MKKLLLSLATVLCMGGFASATDVTVDFSTAEGLPTTESATAEDVTLEGVNFSFVNCKKGTYKGKSYIQVSGKNYQGEAYFTFAVPNAKITKYTVTTGENASTNATINTFVGETQIGETVKLNAKNADFSVSIPEADQVLGAAVKVITVAKYNAQFSKIVIEYVADGAASVAAPVITMVAGDWMYNVEMSCATEGSSIYYTTDGTDPTNASTQYSAAIDDIYEACTIKAIAYVGEDASSITTFDYVPTMILDGLSGLADLANLGAADVRCDMTCFYQKNNMTFFSQGGVGAMAMGENQPAMVNGSKFSSVRGRVISNDGQIYMADPVYGDITTGDAVEPLAQETFENVKAYNAYRYFSFQNLALTHTQDTEFTAKFSEGDDTTSEITINNIFGINLPAGNYSSLEGIVISNDNGVYLAPTAAVYVPSGDVTEGQVTFDFSSLESANSYGYTVSADELTSGNGANLCEAAGSSQKYTNGDIDLYFGADSDATASQIPKLWCSKNGLSVRAYAKDNMSISSSNPNVMIQKVVFEQCTGETNWSADNTYTPDTFVSDTKTWNGGASDAPAYAFDLVFKGATRFQKVNVFYQILSAVKGIESVDNNAAPVYYNLQGVRVANPNNGIYIQVKGGKATKVLVK